MAAPTSVDRRLVEHVDRLAAEHPPIPLESVDYTVRQPELLRDRFGHVLDYMARVELEVDRNVLELTTLLPDPPGSTGTSTPTSGTRRRPTTA